MPWEVMPGMSIAHARVIGDGMCAVPERPGAEHHTHAPWERVRILNTIKQHGRQRLGIGGLWPGANVRECQGWREEQAAGAREAQARRTGTLSGMHTAAWHGRDLEHWLIQRASGAAQAAEAAAAETAGPKGGQAAVDFGDSDAEDEAGAIAPEDQQRGVAPGEAGKAGTGLVAARRVCVGVGLRPSA